MLVYRIAKQKYIKDLTGIGAKTVGGRWNPKGVAVLYTSTTAALSVLEVLAHLPAAYFPDDMAIATIELPDDRISTIDIKELPKDWNKIPPSTGIQHFALNWISENINLGLKVPSIIVPREQNLLINPLHPDFNLVKLIEIEPFSFDTRLLK
ncbi:RES family NAD+ phosphorylase [Aquimarina sp. MMG015]|uniref:RES family NAD+ phosphorylase n=1 Tax=Aquimarina TaxID=290174 RepID=UPI0004150B1E|nr:MULTISPECIES: RES family NAD+ phosphorylase [Aquimarina]AXT55886.1 RES domain-containing protein [Aquimarina sp. AD1]MBQ4805327.1 RES family NAD+ phosphorylase [Aquimarina sp. MMG015]RKN10744.1 RES domain-containing protein [Aquimarina sp. AD1]